MSPPLIVILYDLAPMDIHLSPSEKLHTPSLTGIVLTVDLDPLLCGTRLISTGMH